MTQPPLPPAVPPPPPPPGPNLNFALWGDRVIAALIDGVLNLIALVIVLLVVGAVGVVLGAPSAAGNPDNNANPAQQLAAMSTATVCCCLVPVSIPLSMFVVGIFNKVILVRKRGSSIGQGIMKLRVVGPDGQIPSFGKLIVRLLCQMGFALFYILPLLDLLWPLWDQRRQTLHDKAVETYVIKVIPGTV